MIAAVSRRRLFRGTAVAFALAVVTPAAVFAQAASAAPAAESPRTYAVLSLIGDEFTVVTRRAETSSRLDPNDKIVVPVPDATFDKVAFESAERVLSRLKPLSPALRFSIRDPRLFALQDRVLVDTPESHGVREALLGLLRENRVSQLVLLTKRRDEARFRLVDTHTGSGKIAGIGFYIDPIIPIYRSDTGAHSNGYMSPYVYIDVALVDVASMRILHSAPVLESSMSTAAGKSDTFRAWDSMTGEQKVTALDRLIRKGVSTALESVLAE